jgi:hypothetical protein
MRRFLASLLVALFSFALISPAVLASDAEDRLPACCRRIGRHRCSVMSSEAGASSGPAVHAGRCQLFPHGQAAPADPVKTFPPFSNRATTAFLHASAVEQPAALVYESIYDPASPKRGPPAGF